MALQDASSQVDLAFTAAERRGLAYENAFGGAPSFLRRRYAKDLSGAALAVTGVPFDQAVTNRPGARFGPRAIREASTLQPFDPPFGWDGFDPLSAFEIVDMGDLAFDYAKTAEFPARLTAHVAAILQAGALPLVLGGDHFISLPILRAQARRHGPLALVHFDAHSDTWRDDDPARLDHGTMFYKALREGLITPERSVQVGIRTVNAQAPGLTWLTAPEVHRNGPDWTAARIREIVGSGPAYLSFDIDCLDPAFAPGTGTPVWGGLASWQAAEILRGLKGMRFTGADVVEVSPPFDPTGATAIAGAHVAMELLCLLLWPRRKQDGAAQTPSGGIE